MDCPSIFPEMGGQSLFGMPVITNRALWANAVLLKVLHAVQKQGWFFE